MRDISLITAFGAGLLSFLSPCVLPLIPGYLSFISGAQVSDARDKNNGVLRRTLFFVLGFSIVFIALGFLFSGGSKLASPNINRIISIVAGVCIMILGFNIIFDFMKFLNVEIKAKVSGRPVNGFGALLFGMSFAAGWTPCIGPILAAILFMAGRSGSFLQAFFLLASYSAGLALPFIAAGLFFDRMKPVWEWFKRHAKAVKIVSGLLLIVLGFSMAVGRISMLSMWAAQLGMALEDHAASLSAKLWTSAVLVLCALLIIALPLVRKRNPFTARRIVISALLVTAAVLEMTQAISIPAFIASWLLFQGG